MAPQKIKFSSIFGFVLLSFCLVFGACNEKQDGSSNSQQAEREKQSDPQMQKTTECCTVECPNGSCTAHGSSCNCTCFWWGNPDCTTSESKQLELSEDFKDFHDDIYADVVSTWDQGYKHDIKNHLDSLKVIYDDSNGELNSKDNPSLYEDYVYHNKELQSIAENKLTDAQKREVNTYVREY